MTTDIKQKFSKLCELAEDTVNEYYCIEDYSFDDIVDIDDDENVIEYLGLTLRFTLKSGYGYNVSKLAQIAEKFKEKDWYVTAEDNHVVLNIRVYY